MLAARFLLVIPPSRDSRKCLTGQVKVGFESLNEGLSGTIVE
jgi:hypothetical protein